MIDFCGYRFGMDPDTTMILLVKPYLKALAEASEEQSPVKTCEVRWHDARLQKASRGRGNKLPRRINSRAANHD
jgi:hypothetical protein